MTPTNGLINYSFLCEVLIKASNEYMGGETQILKKLSSPQMNEDDFQEEEAYGHNVAGGFSMIVSN